MVKKAKLTIIFDDKTGEKLLRGEDVTQANLVEALLMVVKALVDRDPKCAAIGTTLDLIAYDRDVVLGGVSKCCKKKQAKSTKKVTKKATKKVAKRK